MMQFMPGMMQGVGQIFAPFPIRRRQSVQTASATNGPVTITPVPIPPIPPIEDSTFVFTQILPATPWIIDHPFIGQFPSVTVVDLLGNVVLVNVSYTSGLDQVIVTPALPLAGRAFLNV